MKKIYLTIVALLSWAMMSVSVFAVDIIVVSHGQANDPFWSVAKNGVEAASWTFPKLMEHWTTKHSKAAYIPSIKKAGAKGNMSYHFGSKLKLFEGTNFEVFLAGFVEDLLYLDPAHKIEHMSTTRKPKKKRNQFRVKWRDLSKLYLTETDVTL